MPIFDAALTAGLLLRTETRPSTVPGVGLGLFALEEVDKGRFVGMDFPDPSAAYSAREVLELSPELRKYCWRHVEHLCFAGTPPIASDHLNHSFTPNLLWHLGYYFTLVQIAVGDELFIDYRFLIDPAWSHRVNDRASGRPVEGMEWRDAIVRSCKQLIALLEETSDR
jgi:hypothetical protein